jgi:hypothetical protein
MSIYFYKEYKKLYKNDQGKYGIKENNYIIKLFQIFKEKIAILRI